MAKEKKSDTTPENLKPQKKLSLKKLLFFIALGLVIIILALGTFLYLRVNSSVSKTFEGNAIQAITSSEPLKQENGITSILIFGNSSDDPNHGGALLADSIMVASLNANTGNAKTVSIPRDLWIEYDRKCSNGSAGKINAFYQCALKNTKDQRQASRLFADKVSSIIGMPIQYYVEANYSVVRESVDAVGGVDIVISSSDPRGVLDRTFDKKCPDGPYTCHYVKYDNGPVHLDGQHALYLARARNAKDGYGLPRSNFDREVNQQLILKGIQQKAQKNGILSNPLASLRLLDSLGDNVVTNISTKELRSATSALNKVVEPSITSIPLNTRQNPLVTTGNQNGQSIILPTAGLYDYSALQSEIQKAFAS